MSQVLGTTVECDVRWKKKNVGRIQIGKERKPRSMSDQGREELENTVTVLYTYTLQHNRWNLRRMTA